MNTSVKIGGITYPIVEVDGLARDHDLYGQCTYTHPLIKLDTELPRDRKHQALVHEMLHAIFYEAGYNDHEEEVVRRITSVLHMVLRDNDFSFLREVTEVSAD